MSFFLPLIHIELVDRLFLWNFYVFYTMLLFGKKGWALMLQFANQKRSLTIEFLH